MIHVFALIAFVVWIVGCQSKPTFIAPPFTVDVPNWQTWDNGLKTLFVKDAQSAKVQVTFAFSHGRLDDPTHQSGLNALTLSLLDRGSSQKGPDEMAEAWGDLATSLMTSGGRNSSHIGASVLPGQENELMELIKESLVRPAFSQKEFQKAKTAQRASVNNFWDHPRQLTSGILKRLVFSNLRPAAGTESGLKHIRRRDVVRHFFRFFRPKGSHLVVIGNFHSDFPKSAKKILSSWKGSPTQPSRAKDNPLPQHRVWIIEDNKSQQTQVRIGQKSLPWPHPDRVPFELANQIYGQGMESRLLKVIRDELGLTYGIYSGIHASPYSGFFGIQAATKHSQVSELLKQTVAITKSYQKTGASMAEIERAKQLSIHQFPLAYERLLSRTFAFSWLGRFDRNINQHVNGYSQRMRSVNPMQMKSVFLQQVSMSQWITVIHTKKGTAIEIPKELGKARRLTLTTAKKALKLN